MASTILSHQLFPGHRHAGVLLRCAFLLAAALHPAIVIGQAYDTIDGHPCFRNLKGITESMFDLADKYPDLASVSVIGESYLKSTNSNNDEYELPQNGYDLYAMNITASDGPHQSSAKGKTLIITGVHAREYAPPELAMRFAETLLDGYDSNSDITWILQHTEVHFIFHVNPDARFITENYPETSWRKNADPEQSGGCSSNEIGVDLNRNFDFMWGETDEGASSSDPCDDTYHGPSPFSEPESQAVAKYARGLFPEEQRRDNPEANLDVPLGEDIMGMFVDIHSSGGYIYYPWGYKDATSPDDDALQALGRKLSFFNDYVLWAGGQPDFVYPASGDSSDYMYAVMGVASFGLELGEDFYEDCDLFADTVIPDNLPALLYAASTSKKPFSLVKGPDILDFEVIISGNARDGVLLVTAVASDSQMINKLDGYPDVATGDQGVARVQLYLDIHPDDYKEGSMTWDMQPAGGNDMEQSFELEVSVAEGFSSCRHTLFAQAMDTDGYLGPVSSAFFYVEKIETGAPSKSPTSPTHQPTFNPSKDPSGAPTTDQPSASPTESITSSPSQTPSRSPETAKPSSLPTESPTATVSTATPSVVPTRSPTTIPSKVPTRSPATVEPSASPTGSPTLSLETLKPSSSPTVYESSSAPSHSSTSVTSSDTPIKQTYQPTVSPSYTSTTSNPTFLGTNASPITSNSTLFSTNATKNTSYASNNAFLSINIALVSALFLLHIG